MGNTTRNGPEDPARVGGISETGSTIPHQYKTTPTIFPRKPYSTEEDVSEVDTGEIEAEDIW